MQIMLKRSKIFYRPRAVAHPEMGGAVPTIEDTLQLTVGGPYSVPDWVVETDTYKLGVKDGSIVDITPQPTPVDEAA